jgi:hypothetical protein
MTQKNHLKLEVFIGNKSIHNLQNVSIEYDGDCNSCTIYQKGETNIPKIEAKKQEKFEILTHFKKYPYKNVSFEVKYQISDIVKEIYTFIPFLLTKFMKFKKIDVFKYKNKWK